MGHEMHDQSAAGRRPVRSGFQCWLFTRCVSLIIALQVNQLFKVLRVLRVGRMLKRIETKTAVRMSLLTVVKARRPSQRCAFCQCHCRSGSAPSFSRIRMAISAAVSAVLLHHRRRRPLARVPLVVPRHLPARAQSIHRNTQPTPHRGGGYFSCCACSARPSAEWANGRPMTPPALNPHAGARRAHVDPPGNGDGSRGLHARQHERALHGLHLLVCAPPPPQPSSALR